MRVSVVIFPGSNCDRDMMVAVERITGRRPQMIWHKETGLDACDLVIVPGGFSFGDYLRCGALAARSPIMEAVLDHASRGGAILGVCNGFQILLETGLLPGTLVKNKGLKFICRETLLEVQNTMDSPFTSGLEAGSKLAIPVAHNEGNYFAEDDTLASLRDNGQIALTYTQGTAFGPSNPNGSSQDIAGILSPNGRIMGMMPHPERAADPDIGNTDGLTFLTNAIKMVAA